MEATKCKLAFFEIFRRIFLYINFYQHIHFQYNFFDFDVLHSSSHSFLMYITDLISVILLVFMAILYTTRDAPI